MPWARALPWRQRLSAACNRRPARVRGMPAQAASGMPQAPAAAACHRRQQRQRLAPVCVCAGGSGDANMWQRGLSPCDSLATPCPYSANEGAAHAAETLLPQAEFAHIGT
ncbi:hypothetical protein FNV43_RR21512 [Rhamnella rubrinervis]|uniref:Uncharacterized protein n=1 Tax=Rhamnella rubrinervis TaxID=2594499 RepID=A0A8K0GVF0_9ROSA|nr:hypothetical protein FNV43_RR21512 [Rhamnella rubrinervis]